MRNLLSDLGYIQHEPTIIYEDNSSCINMVYSDSLNHKTTKHINNKFHYTKELVKQRVVQIRHLATKEMTADLLTKPLFVAQHHKLTTKMINL